MIVMITTRRNGYTFRTLVKREFGVPTPRVRRTSYDRMFGAWVVPRATYVFCDIERLAPWELRVAADLYRAMTSAGLSCLNDPARVMSRLELLNALHIAGINSFTALPADCNPRPSRFPVFIRTSDNHDMASPRLYQDQAALDAALADLRSEGTPLRGMMVVEQAPASYGDNLFAKWSTWRVRDEVFVDHLVVDDNWLVKRGDHFKATDASVADERDAVVSNRFAPHLQRAFEIAGIEFGRADHSVVDGRTMVYEINTNPFISRLSPDPRAMRRETLMLARAKFASALEKVDTARGGLVRVEGSELRRQLRWWWPGFVTPRRP